MTLTIHWYYIVIVLFLIPILYGIFHKLVYEDDMVLDVLVIVITTACWCAGIGLLLGKLF